MGAFNSCSCAKPNKNNVIDYNSLEVNQKKLKQVWLHDSTLVTNDGSFDEFYTLESLISN